MNREHSNKANGSIWIEKRGVKYFGKGPYQLLTGIQETGSIQLAAKNMELSYKKAWTIIHRINEVMGKEIILTQAGGAKGGGAFLTEDAVLLMKKYKKLIEQFQQFLEKEHKDL